MNNFYFIICFLLFFHVLQLICEKYPIIKTEIKYNKIYKNRVRYTIFIINGLFIDDEVIIFSKEDRQIIWFIYFVNSVLNMNIRIL